MDIQELVSEDFVLFTEQRNKNKLLEELSAVLKAGGKVKDSFSKAVIERERKFPTGLKTEYVGVAIPHTDSVHVNEPAIAIALLENKAPFIEMGTTSDDVQVEIVFMLALKKAEDQLEMLQILIDLIQDEEVMISLKQAADGKEVLKLIKNYYGKN